MLHANSLMPHAVCWAPDPGLIWTMVVTNAITFLSYLTIAWTLFYLVKHTGRSMVRDWGYFVVGFGLFILACGATHLMEVITTWTPIFWVDAWTNIITSILSACVAFMLIQRVSTLAYGINDYADRLANTETEKQRVEDSLVAARKLEDWSRMSAAFSHEIKNPLQAIQNLQFLIGAQPGVSAQIVDMARLASEEAQRVLAIADLSLSFIRQTPEHESIDLPRVVESVEFLLAPLIRKKSIVAEVSSSGDCTVEGNAGEVRQVLLNVIRNACEAVTTQGAHVGVELAGDAEGVRVSVTDDGSGIREELLPGIFEFGSSTKGEQGNGMGLWTVKHLIDKHHGQVTVQSAVGEGTRVTLWWPRDQVGGVGAERAIARN
jgi:signal transduction histidine kinase